MSNCVRQIKEKPVPKAKKATEKPKAASKPQKNLKKPKKPAAEKTAKPEPAKAQLAETEEDTTP